MKRVMCVAISLLFIITIGINTTGYNAEQSVYTTENGEKVYYHLDTDGNPYIIDESGNQIYLTLPLSHLEVTDPAIIVSLEAGRSAVECKAQSRSTPVVGFDLSNCAADAPSRKYTVTVSVPSVATTFITPVFKFNTAHEVRLLMNRRGMRDTKSILIIFTILPRRIDGMHCLCKKRIVRALMGLVFKTMRAPSLMGNFIFGKVVRA